MKLQEKFGIYGIDDERTRKVIYPNRVVLTRGNVTGAENLKKFRPTQVAIYAYDDACVLDNRGSTENAAVLVDFGREIHGTVTVSIFTVSTQHADFRLRFGESVSEAITPIGEKGTTNDHAERDMAFGAASWSSNESNESGFRFAYLELLTPNCRVELRCIEGTLIFRDIEYKGSFQCSDPLVNQIYDTAAYTVHLNMQRYLWDGIKRDRLVWVGDLHPETMAILNVFGDAQILADSLDYLASVTPPDKWMNTIATYTLWWIRNLAEWYRFTGDRQYLEKHADYLEKTFGHVLSGMTDAGEWRAGEFLDWPTKHNGKGQVAGTQGLALIAARETAFLADALGREDLADKARGMADRLSRLRPDPHGAKSAAALLALSGLRTPREMYASTLGAGGHSGVSSFYGYYMIEAMSAVGEHQRALDTVRDYWGAMLDMGATSFWEDFNISWTNNAFRVDEAPVPGKKDIHGDYGEFCYKGFRHSLCHGWSAGPASWCINNVLGIRPVGVGCRTVEVNPSLGDLDWAEGAMAMPGGKRILVRIDKRSDGSLDVKVDAPDGVKVIRPQASVR